MYLFLALARMREHILLFNTNSDITAVIKAGASNRFVFVILILFDAFVNNWESVNFNISAVIFNRRIKKIYVTFKLDPFNRFTRSWIAIALEAFGRLMLDPSIGLLRLITLVSTYLAITSFTFLVIYSGGTITLATCGFGGVNLLAAFSTNFSINRNCFTHINSFHSNIFCRSFSSLKSCRR